MENEFEMTSKLSVQAIEKMLNGEPLEAKGLKIKIESVNGDHVRFSLHLVDKDLKELSLVIRARMEVGDTLTVTEFEKAVRFKISQG